MENIINNEMHDTELENVNGGGISQHTFQLIYYMNRKTNDNTDADKASM